MKIKCEGCGCEVNNSEAIRFEGYLYCEDCVRHCGDCGELTLSDCGTWVGDKFVCDSCLSNDYFYCNCCEEYYSNNEQSYYIDSEDIRVCEVCYCDHYGSCERCGYTTSLDYLYWSDRDGCYYCDSCDEAVNYSKVYEYHSSLGRGNKSENYRYRVGIELEREDSSFLDSLDKEHYLDDLGWVIERDGSLGDDGFEAISPILPLKIGRLSKMFKEEDLNSLVSSDFSSSCGGHITISDTKRRPCDIIDDIAGYLPIFYALFPNRVDNGYCYPLAKDSYKETRGHCAFNIRSDTLGGGLEIRLFDAPLDREDLENRFRLVKFILQHKANSVSKGLKMLNDSDKLRRIIKNHLDRFNMSIEDFYTNLVAYSERWDKVKVNPKRAENIAKKIK